MQYWNITTDTVWSDRAVKNIINPTNTDRYAAGRREIVLFSAPDGYVPIPRTKRIEIDGDTVREVYDVQTKTAATEEADAIAQAEHDTGAPSGTLASWSKREKCLLLVCYKLAQQHWPNMTKAQFLANVKAEWDAVQ